MILKSINHCLNQVKNLLLAIDQKHYSESLVVLSTSTIGQHIRHILEMFLSLTNEYEVGIVNYDNRERNYLIETDPIFAKNQIDELLKIIDKPDKKLILHQNSADEIIAIKTNYFRELVYNLEHCIHHQALIKIGILANFDYKIDKDFGVAFSTIEYRKKLVLQ